jgi:germination protein M
MAMQKYIKNHLAATVLASTLLLSGCGLFGGEEQAKEIDPPQDQTYVDDEKALGNNEQSKGKESADTKNKKEEANVETVSREIYLIDKNGYVVPQTFQLPKTESVAKQALEYLVDGGPISNLLPNGFRAVLPRDTQVLGVNILEDGTAIADFSPEFSDYKSEDELKILQAITWTLTQFDNIKKVKIRINGHEQTEMPVNGTPIGEGFSRADGINFDNGEVVDFTNSTSVTLYFMAQDEKQTYYVPVTKRIENTEKDKFAAVVSSLIKGPSHNSGLVSDFQPDVKLLKTKYENGTVTLDFNEEIFGSFKEKMISKHVIDTLVLSLTEQPGVENVAITVNGKDKVLKEDGKPLTEPVSRPQNVNTGSF